MTGSLAIVGLGPGDPDWITPETTALLAAAEEVLGYGPYLARLGPPIDGQRRHATDNREEIARARHALDLAAAGRRVAVVSAGTRASSPWRRRCSRRWRTATRHGGPST